MAPILRLSLPVLPPTKPASHLNNASNILRDCSRNVSRRSCFSFRSFDGSSILISSAGYDDMGRLKYGFGHKGFECPQFGVFFSERSVGDGGFSGRGGGFSGGGDGRSGGEGEADGSKSGSSLFAWYLSALGNHPVLTKSLTSALLTLIGDLICQLLIDQVPKLDLKRTLIFTFLGFSLVGPTLHFWYLSLSNLINIKGTLGSFVRLLLDQFVFSPLFIGVFLSLLVSLEGRPEQVFPTLKQEWFSSVVANWQLWIPFQFLNFQFVPQQFQVLVANFVAVAWNVILSFKAHKEIVLK